jgi:RNA polymerase sigma-70 factor (ECF subfamily)
MQLSTHTPRCGPPSPFSSSLENSQRQRKAADDLVLVHASKCGDTEAFEELVRRYRQKLLRVAQGLTHNHEDAQDAVQEAFLKAYRKLDQFQGNAKFSSWLFRINVNESRIKMRNRSAACMQPSEDLNAENFPRLGEIPDRAPNPEALCHFSELRHILMKASLTLGPRLRTVFVLRDVEGLSIDQTATALHLNQSAVKTRLRRAHVQLRGKLSRAFGFPGKIGMEFRTVPSEQLVRKIPKELPS